MGRASSFLLFAALAVAVAGNDNWNGLKSLRHSVHGPGLSYTAPTCKVPLKELKDMRTVLDNFIKNGKTDKELRTAGKKMDELVPRPDECQNTLTNIRENSKKLMQWHLDLINQRVSEENIAKIRANFEEIRAEIDEKIAATERAVKQKKKMIKEQIRQNKDNLVVVSALQIMAGDYREAADTFAELPEPKNVDSVVLLAYQPGYIEDIMKFLKELETGKGYQMQGVQALRKAIKNEEDTDEPNVYSLVYHATLFKIDSIIELDVNELKNELRIGIENKMKQLSSNVNAGQINEVREYSLGDYYGFFDVFLEDFIQVSLDNMKKYTLKNILKVSETFSNTLKSRTYLKIINQLRNSNGLVPDLFPIALKMGKIGQEEFLNQIVDKSLLRLASASEFTIRSGSNYLGVVDTEQVGYVSAVSQKSTWQMEIGEKDYQDSFYLALRNKMNGKLLEEKTPKVGTTDHASYSTEFKISLHPTDDKFKRESNDDMLVLIHTSSWYLVPGDSGPRVISEGNVYDVKNYWIISAA